MCINNNSIYKIDYNNILIPTKQGQDIKNDFRGRYMVKFLF